MQPQSVQTTVQPTMPSVGAAPINPIVFTLCFYNMTPQNGNATYADSSAAVSAISVLLASLLSPCVANTANAQTAQAPSQTPNTTSAPQDAEWERLYDEYVNSFIQYEQHKQSATDASQYWQHLFEAVNQNKLQNPFFDDVKSAAATLGISVNATAAELKQAYRNLCSSVHPDVTKNTTEQTVTMIPQIITAHAVMLRHISQKQALAPIPQAQPVKPAIQMPKPAPLRATRVAKPDLPHLKNAKPVRSVKKIKKIKKPKVCVKKSAASQIMPIVKSGKQTKQVLVSKPQLTTNTAKMPLHLLRLRVLMAKRSGRVR